MPSSGRFGKTRKDLEDVPSRGCTGRLTTTRSALILGLAFMNICPVADKVKNIEIPWIQTSPRTVLLGQWMRQYEGDHLFVPAAM